MWKTWFSPYGPNNKWNNRPVCVYVQTQNHNVRIWQFRLNASRSNTFKESLSKLKRTRINIKLILTSVLQYNWRAVQRKNVVKNVDMSSLNFITLHITLLYDQLQILDFEFAANKKWGFVCFKHFGEKIGRAFIVWFYTTVLFGVFKHGLVSVLFI